MFSLQAYYYYFHVSNLVVSANSAVNFVVYCVFRRQFRHRLRAYCRGQRAQRGLLYRSAVTGVRRATTLVNGASSVAMGGDQSSLGIDDAMHYPLRVVAPTTGSWKTSVVVNNSPE